MENRTLYRLYVNDIEWMVEAYAEYVYGLAFRLTCDPIVAEDVTCATFLSAQALGGEMSESDCVAGILYRITSAISRTRLMAIGEPELVDVPSADLGYDAHGAEPGYRLDVSLDCFRSGLEIARAALDAAIRQGGNG